MAATTLSDTDLDSPRNCTELAQGLRKSRQYVSAMREAGYPMEFGTTTTLRHARQWQREHPEFRVNDYIARHRGNVGSKGGRPRKQHPAASTVDK